jgi:HlyD family secretion protein
VIGRRKSRLYRTVGAFDSAGRTIRAALPWGLGESDPNTDASVSIRRHILAGAILVGALVLGLGGWAATAQISGALTGLTAQQDAKDKGIALTEQELQGVRDLWQKNLTSLQREEAQLQVERGQIVAQVAEAKGKIAEIQLQIIQVDEDLSSDVAKELRDIDSKIGEFVERKVTAEDPLKRTDIHAPQDCIVFQSTANTVGGVIAAGDPIMLIVPESDNLMVEVKVDPKDIDQVQFGQPVVLRFTSFNARTTPELNGTVSRIAADTTTDQRTGQSYYLVRISMTADEIKRLGDVKLTPGMPVEAFIETGERTMLSYLVKPLRDQLMRAFREK